LVRDLDQEVKQLRAELAARLTVDESDRLRTSAAMARADLADQKALTARERDRADRAADDVSRLTAQRDHLADHAQRTLSLCTTCADNGTSIEVMAILGALGRLNGAGSRASVRRLQAWLDSDPALARAKAESAYRLHLQHDKAGPA
jgi:hypothetical protein